MSNSKIYLLLMVALSLVACSENYTPDSLPEPNAIKEGKGLFSGEDGTLTLYASDEDVCGSQRVAKATVRSLK
ncbi:MAG: hypothetical protein K0M45_05280 [Candidatus Paracaedibacteraceae bacterium]|nr:hypothetical protein [Candidatus Paracaedibacteraceae bacterium]